MGDRLWEVSDGLYEDWEFVSDSWASIATLLEALVSAGTTCVRVVEVDSGGNALAPRNEVLFVRDQQRLAVEVPQSSPGRRFAGREVEVASGGGTDWVWVMLEEEARHEGDEPAAVSVPAALTLDVAEASGVAFQALHRDPTLLYTMTDQ